MGLLCRLASTRLTLVGMVLLVIGAALSYNNPVETSIWVLVVPLALLSVNLFSAIVTNNRINQRSGLLVFHIALLSIAILAAIGRLTHFDAHVEMIDGAAFDPQLVDDVRQGPFHGNGLEQVNFVQRHYTVDYAPGLVRGLTYSHLDVLNKNGVWEEKVVGDDRPLIVNGYRFYTSYYKGFAPILTWLPAEGESITGAVHMPAYPLFEHRQDNSWQPPGEEPIRFWLQLETGLDKENHWVLDGSRHAEGVLVVNTSQGRVELKPGDETVVGTGRLRYETMRTWMGYKIFYDPTISWLFYISVLGVFGLFFHFWQKLRGIQKASSARYLKGSLPGVKEV